MIVLHILDCSLPIVCGYSIRSHHILNFQKQFCVPYGITSPYYDYEKQSEKIDNCYYYRSRKSKISQVLYNLKIPVVKHLVIQRDFEKIIDKIVKSLRPSIIHGHNWHNVSFPAYRIAKKYKIPFVYEIRGLWEDTAVTKGLYKMNSLPYKYNKYFETTLAKKADAIFTISYSLKMDLISRGISEHKIEVIPNGIIACEHTYDGIKELRERYELNNHIVIGYIGALNIYESLDLLIKLISKLLEKSHKVKGFIVGDGSEFNHLKALTHSLGLNKYIVFTGKVSPKEIRKYYSLIDIFTITRYLGREVQLVAPLKPYEAMEAGNCLLLSDLPALKEIVLDGKTGVLYRAGDIESLTEKCEILIRNESMRKRLSESARNWVLENNKWEKLVYKYYDIYENLIPRLNNSK